MSQKVDLQMEAFRNSRCIVTTDETGSYLWEVPDDVDFETFVDKFFAEAAEMCKKAGGTVEEI